jgi:hypothetical protein
METAFYFPCNGVLIAGVVIHGGEIPWYGAAPPEVIIDKVVDEEAGTETLFSDWLAAHPKQGIEQRRMVAAMEEAVIEKVCKPRDPEDEEACRGDYERDTRKDTGR